MAGWMLDAVCCMLAQWLSVSKGGYVDVFLVGWVTVLWTFFFGDWEVVLIKLGAVPRALQTNNSLDFCSLRN